MLVFVQGSRDLPISIPAQSERSHIAFAERLGRLCCCRAKNIDMTGKTMKETLERDKVIMESQALIVQMKGRHTYDNGTTRQCFRCDLVSLSPMDHAAVYC